MQKERGEMSAYLATYLLRYLVCSNDANKRLPKQMNMKMRRGKMRGEFLIGGAAWLR